MKNIMTLIVLFFLAGCALTGSQEDGVGENLIYHYDLEDGRFFMGIRGTILEPVPFSFVPEGATDVIVIKFTSDLSLETAMWSVENQESNLIKSASYDTSDDQDLDIFKGPDGSLYFATTLFDSEDTLSTCSISLYTGPDESTCFLEDEEPTIVEIKYIGFDNGGNFYYLGYYDGDLKKRSADGTIATLVDFVAGLVDKIQVDTAGNVLVQAGDDMDDDSDYRTLFFVFADGSLYELTEQTGLWSNDIYYDNSGQFLVLGENSDEASDGLYRLDLNETDHTVSPALLASYTIDSSLPSEETNAGKLSACNFVRDIDRAFSVYCNGIGIIIGLPDAPFLIPHGFIAGDDPETLIISRNGYVYVALDGGVGEAQELDGTVDGFETEDNEADSDYSDDTLAEIDSSTGSTRTLWTSGGGDLLQLDYFFVDEAGFIYFAGLCSLGESAEIGGDETTGGCIGYFDSNAEGNPVILETVEEFRFNALYGGYWEF